VSTPGGTPDPAGPSVNDAIEPAPITLSASALPTGRVTFLFTDLEGSTRAWEADPAVMNVVLARHDELVRGAIESNGGVVFAEAGDAFAAAFPSSELALAAAVSAQRALAAAPWPGDRQPSVRMGLHVGDSYERDQNYFGPTLNRAARIMSSAHGGQIVASEDTVTDGASLPDGVSVRALGTFHLKDVTETVAISQVVVDGLRRDFPPLETLDRRDVRVPQTRTSFVGRADELADVSDRLVAGGVVTLVAAGGTGKTRLSHEVALASAGFFPGGVYLVELEDVSPGEVVHRAATTVLGDSPLARAEAGDDLAAALLDHLVVRSALVVFDNCEHVLAETAALVESLSLQCPKVSILASSRERLGVSGEQVVALRPLAVRDDAAGGARPSLAADLFCDRALAAQASFAPSAEDRVTIEEICRAVDGLPLAIELAASRVRTLSVTQIADRLSDALALLRQPRSTRHPRHQSLETTIAWSFDLLDLPERRMLAWSSVFASGCSMEAFEHLSEAADPDEDGLTLLESLCDKSLLTAEHRGDLVRYRLAAPIRQFAARQLDERGERDDAELAHITYFRALGHATDAEISGKPARVLLAERKADNDNFVVCINRAAARGDRSNALLTAIGLHTYWEETGSLAQASEIIESVVGDDLTDPMTFRGVGILLAYAPMCGNMRRAIELGDALTPALDQPLPPKLAGQLRFTLGFLHSSRGNLVAAADLWAEAGEMLVGVDDQLARQALFNAGHSSTHAGRWDEARRFLDQAATVPPPVQGWFPDLTRVTRALLDIYTGAGGVDELLAGAKALDSWGLQFRLMLASVDAATGLFRAGSPVEAEQWWRRLLDIGQEMGNVWAALMSLEFAAWSEVARGDDQRAAEIWGCIDRFALDRGYGWWDLIAAGGAERRALVTSRSPAVFEEATRQGSTRTLHEETEAVLRTAPLQEGTNP